VRAEVATRGVIPGALSGVFFPVGAAQAEAKGR
jgi:hypothetical protein